jgi:hypothetical protein
MFTALKRGPSSILKVSRTGSSFFTPINKSSPVFSSLRIVQRSAVGSRWLSTTPRAQYYGGAQAVRRQPYAEPEEIIPTRSNEPVYTKFQELAEASLVHPKIVRDITHGMGHETMTPVQAMTINESLKGKDTLVRPHSSNLQSPNQL